MIRFILVALFLVAFLIITIPLDIILYFVGRKNRDKQIAICRSIVHWAFSFILKIAGADVTAEGQENIPDGPVLFMGNHQSYFDILTTYVKIPGGVGYVSKKEMDNFPLLNLWMRGINCLFLDRDNIREGLKTILKGVEELKNGHSMFIFPEGTRNQGEEMLPFKEGSTKMAEKAKAPIVPVAILGTADLFENNKGLRITPAKVHITFGEPIIISDLSKEDKKFLGAYTQGIIKEMRENAKETIA